MLATIFHFSGVQILHTELFFEIMGNGEGNSEGILEKGSLCENFRLHQVECVKM